MTRAQGAIAMNRLGGDFSCDVEASRGPLQRLVSTSREGRKVDFLERAFSWSNALLELVIFLERWLFPLNRRSNQGSPHGLKPNGY